MREDLLLQHQQKRRPFDRYDQKCCHNLIGGVFGLFLKGRLPERFRQMVINGLGLCTLAFGVQ